MYIVIHHFVIYSDTHGQWLYHVQYLTVACTLAAVIISPELMPSKANNNKNFQKQQTSLSCSFKLSLRTVTVVLQGRMEDFKNNV